MAGKPSASPAPFRAASTMNIQSSAWSVITRKARSPWVVAASRLETWSTTARGNRSAITPPNSRNSTIGMVCAAST